MSAELDSIIQNSIATIDGGSDGGDTGDSGDSGDAGTADSGTDSGTDLSTTDATDSGTDAGAEGQEDASGLTPEPSAADIARTAEEAAFDAELAELGLSAPKPGQRDNRIPYSRIRKIVANAKTKWSEKLKGEHTVELTAREQKIQEFEQQAKEFNAAERLIETDPERYLELLGQIYPKQYKQFSKQQAAQVEKPQEPQPDVKYDDGSLGYSPEQFAKLREYDRTESARVAEERSTRQFNERFGPIEQEWKATQQDHQDLRRVRGDIGKLSEQWGADQIENPEVQKAIIAHMDANPKSTLVSATRTVVMKRIQADRTTMRAEILKEMKGAPKAAAKAPNAPVRSDAASMSESIDDIIANAARSLR